MRKARRRLTLEGCGRFPPLARIIVRRSAFSPVGLQLGVDAFATGDASWFRSACARRSEQTAGQRLTDRNASLALAACLGAQAR
jgi:hypothetical protein